MGTKLRFLSALILVALTGCVPGLLYTNIVRPECKDMRSTTLGSKSGSGSSKRLEIPTTRLDLTAEWDSKAIGDIAKANGISTVHACDERTFALLGGLYRQEEIIVYGE